MKYRKKGGGNSQLTGRVNSRGKMYVVLRFSQEKKYQIIFQKKLLH
jgi:hypothetical protein